MDWKKYAYTFLITTAIFITAILASNYFNQKKINEIKKIESRISVDILASETQFSLLSELSCKQINNNSLLSKELATLGEKLDYTEKNRGSDDLEVVNLKKYYSLLQIKDFVLMQKINERCGGKNLSLMYFYSNESDKCRECENMGFVLTRLRQEYPELRIYSFDYDLDLSVVKTLISIYNIENKQPAILVNDEIYYGFKSIDEIKNIIPALKEIDKEKAKSQKNRQSTSTKAN